MQRKFDKILGKIMGEAVSWPPFSSCPLPGKSAEWTSVLVAVSGGMDSMCLAELFLHSSLGVRFEIAHCNFHLRGEESDSDTALVRSWGERNGVHVNVAEFETSSYAAEHGLSIEMAARELRYRWFGKLCRERGCIAVAVAHHADDNAETLFLNLVRGTGLRGLCGMSPVAAMPCQDDDCGCRKPVLIRPLLDFTRDQIDGYVRRHRIEYHTDRTNADTKYRRNLIRHEVFPLLEKLNPSFIKTVNREMKYFSQANEIVESVFDSSSWPQDNAIVIPGIGEGNQRSRLNVAKESDKFTINMAELLSAPYWEYRLYRILEQYGFNSSTVASIEELLKANAESGRTLAGKRFFSPSHVLVTTSASLIVEDRSSRPQDDTAVIPDREAVKESVLVDSPGEYHIGNTGFTVEVVPRSEITSLKAQSGTVYMDADALPFPFVCRRWRHGDWLHPFGMKGKKKVSDLFTDLKYDILRKDDTVLIEAPAPLDGHVLALLGERIDDSVKITDRTLNVIVARVL